MKNNLLINYLVDKKGKNKRMDISNFREISVQALAADYKYRGLNRHRAWDQLVIDCGLVPGIDAKDFYKIFDAVEPSPLIKDEPPSDFKPTHFDNYWGCKCEIITRDDGVIEIRWENGHYGGYPPCNPPEEGRYTELHEEDYYGNRNEI